jgi:hypothetical protein
MGTQLQLAAVSISHRRATVERANAAVTTTSLGFVRTWENVIPSGNIELSALQCTLTIQNGHHSPIIDEGT